ncbi:hypothetical protein ACMDCR_03885 [Labrys okinawensis]|uniref:hypothetical protein n=1 Tax=Labrys okinawensis TaxID=346911 RepID=UPI0039BCD3AA
MHLGHLDLGYGLFGALILAGLGLLVASLRLTRRIEAATLAGMNFKEKRFEYYRGIATQLGVLLIGIGVSLFIYFFQQNYQDERRREAESQQVLARLASRIGRTSAELEFLSEYDDILDEGGAYVSPSDGGKNGAVASSGDKLVKQIEDMKIVERDVAEEDFNDLDFSTDFQGSSLITELDPALLFAMHREENELKYAIKQLGADFKDLQGVLGPTDPREAISDPVAAGKAKHEALDILYDLDLLRDRSRRAFARACWLVSQGSIFASLGPIEPLSKTYGSHQEWIRQAKQTLSPYRVGNENCFELLGYKKSN